MATAVPLPNGMTQFVDDNGAPYANGQVITYVPGGTTPKTTWMDNAQQIPNTNPVLLDSAGRAIIWGSGIYRQQLWDQYGNLIWDQNTEAADPNYILSILPNFTGDTGSGGVSGTVPAPPAGSAAAGQYLSANGAFGPLLIVVPNAPAANQAGFLFQPSRTIATTSGQLALTDAGCGIIYNNSGAGTLTIPTDATVAWLTVNVITQVAVYNLTTSGALTIARASGVSLVWPGGSGTSANRTVIANGQAVLSRIGANSWNIVGAGIS